LIVSNFRRVVFVFALQGEQSVALVCFFTLLQVISKRQAF
jgi:hypothetical protein